MTQAHALCMGHDAVEKERMARMSHDPIEQDYERAIKAANNRGDSDAAYELSIGLKEYREMYKLE